MAPQFTPIEFPIHLPMRREAKPGLELLLVGEARTHPQIFFLLGLLMV